MELWNKITENEIVKIYHWKDQGKWHMPGEPGLHSEILSQNGKTCPYNMHPIKARFILFIVFFLKWYLAYSNDDDSNNGNNSSWYRMRLLITYQLAIYKNKLIKHNGTLGRYVLLQCSFFHWKKLRSQEPKGTSAWVGGEPEWEGSIISTLLGCCNHIILWILNSAGGNVYNV